MNIRQYIAKRSVLFFVAFQSGFTSFVVGSIDAPMWVRIPLSILFIITGAIIFDGLCRRWGLFDR